MSLLLLLHRTHKTHKTHTWHTAVCTKNADNQAVKLIYTHDFLLCLLRYYSTRFINNNRGLSLFEEAWHSEVSEKPLKDVVYTRCNKVAQDEKHSCIFLPVQPQLPNLVKPPPLLPSIYQSVQSTGSLSFIAAEFLLRHYFLWTSY